MSSYVQPFQISPLTMVALEADGAPLQPHPTIPPYSLRATSLQSSELKFQEPRMPKEWHTQSLGTKSFIEPS